MQAETELLLVDDNSADVKLTLHAMKPFLDEKKIAVARDGEEAIEFLFRTGRYATQQPPLALRLILLDLKLPKVNGFEVLRVIKNDERTRSIPVVILTSSNQERDLIECYRLGANSYVQKPVDFDLFSGLVKQIKEYWFSTNLTVPRVPMTRHRAGDPSGDVQ